MSTRRGFTLIELLVVIAIIALLSSVILASLNSARGKARDAQVRSEIRQLANLMSLEYNENGNFANLQENWIFVPGSPYGPRTCANAPFAGNYAAQALNICNAIAGVNGTGVYMGNTGSPNIYSLMAQLPYKGTVYCLGSGGNSSETETGSGSWTSPGCSANP